MSQISSERSERIRNTYRANENFQLIKTAEDLTEIYVANKLDPRSLDTNIFAIESLAHFLQDGLLKLFEAIGIIETSRVLTVGEGNGAPSRLLAKSIGCNITGADLCQDQVTNAIGCAKLHGIESKVNYNVQDVHQLDLGLQRFDKAYFNETICHWENHQLAFEQIVKHLEPGATIGANLWLSGDKGDLSAAEAAVPGFEGLYDKDVWSQATLSSLSHIWEGLGLKIISNEDLTDEVDQKLKKRIKELELIKIYASGKAGIDFADYGIRYYQIMRDTHYGYLKYGRLVAQLS